MTSELEEEKRKINAVLKDLDLERAENELIQNELGKAKAEHNATKIKLEHLQSEYVVEKRNHEITKR